ncbi:MAG TPA: hypothetical protein VHZ04_03555 [Candidatus Paceibacterota bacterium]|jgi:hypothetical protein|nr:hypothetical protein [Candidatus Paceibacterota bacterium]
MEELKARFLKAYANIPLQMRGEVIAFLDKRLMKEDMRVPITWDVAYLEVQQNTALGEKILRELAGLELI